MTKIRIPTPAAKNNKTSTTVTVVDDPLSGALPWVRASSTEIKYMHI